MVKFVVIGGDAAGMSAAAQVTRGENPVEMVVFERGEHTSYAACGLPYFVAGEVAPERLVARSPEEHRRRGVDVRTGHEVVAIDTAGQTVTVKVVATGETFTEGYDHLLIATGATPIRPPFPNVDAGGVSVVHTIPDALAIDAVIAGRSPRRAVVVGGGYIGLEMVEAFLARGLEVSMVEKLPQPMATLDPDLGDLVAASLVDQGVDVRLGTGVEGIEVDGEGWVRAVATDSGPVPADLVVLALGNRPNVALAEAAGVPLGPTGAIATDSHMATAVAGVWSAGDCAESRHRVSGAPAWVALGTHANKQGRVVGLNVSGTDAEFPGVIGTAVTRVGPTEIGRTGLNQREARAAGFDAVVGTVEGTSRAHYYPGGSPMTVRVVADRGSGRMLGAQIVGGAEAAKRIDALAVAVWNEMTVDQFEQLDLGYAPPFSPVWDPTLVAARMGARARTTS